MPLLRVRPTPSFDSGGDITNHWPLSQASLFAAGSPLDLGSSPQYGTATGAGVKFTEGPFRPREALSFDGTDYIQLAASTLPAAVNLANAHSIFLWANVTDRDGVGGGTFNQSFVGLKDAGGNTLRFSNSSGVGGGFFCSASPTGLAFESTYNINTIVSGRWCFIGYTWDGAASIPYGAGLPTGKESSSNFSNTGAGNTIGAYAATLGQVTGSLRDVRLYNRALAADEVFALYNQAFAPDREMPELFDTAAAAAANKFSNLLLMGVG